MKANRIQVPVHVSMACSFEDMNAQRKFEDDDENRISCHHLGVSYTRRLRFDLSVKMRNSNILPSFLNIVIFTWKSQREHKERDRPGRPDPPIDL